MPNVNQQFARVRYSSLLVASSLFLLTAGTAPALADLSQTDLAAISTAVQGAVSGASQGGPAAMADAIKTVTDDLVGKFGNANCGQVAAVIVADALADGASPQSVGQGIGEAALTVGPPCSDQIADAVGSGGGAEVLAAFDAAVSGQPGGQKLADEADAAANKRNPSAFSVSVGGSVSGSVGVGAGFCVNASCN